MQIGFYRKHLQIYNQLLNLSNHGGQNIRKKKKHKQAYTQEKMDFNDLPRTTLILSLSNSTKELN